MIISFFASPNLAPYRLRERHLRERNADVQEMLLKPMQSSWNCWVEVSIWTEFLIFHKDYNVFCIPSLGPDRCRKRHLRRRNADVQEMLLKPMQS